MSDERSLGFVLLGAGAVLILLGVLAYHGGLRWFGRLPGDIHIERPGFRLTIPITTMLLVSIFGSLLLSLFRRK